MSKVFDIIEKEQNRQNQTIELIASENFVSKDILAAAGSCLTNKYAEGYPVERTSGNSGRYYGGCQYINELEEYCCDQWRKVFNTNYHVNVQPHCGSSANMAAYAAVLKPGYKILSMDLNNGGHLSHGSKVNFSGKLYNISFYGIDKDGFIDYEDLKNKVKGSHPNLILAGASAYSRIIDYQKIYNIIQDEHNYCKMNLGFDYSPYFMVDMAHIAGLIAAGDHPSPFGLADIITTTTHKTLRGPRGGLIFCKPELAKKIDSAVFPGTQGGPLEHVIAGKAICAEEDQTEEYRQYIHNVCLNSKIMAQEFKDLNYHIITDGTDNHMFLLDLTTTRLTGQQVQDLLDKYNITANKNCIPGETRSPKEASGLRIGTAAMTTKGYTAKDFQYVADMIDLIISYGQNKIDENTLNNKLFQFKSYINK